jgi:hypothetical protein
MKEREPGTVREGRIPIYDHKGHMRGHVGPNATSVTVSRFIGNLHGAKLGTKDGRDAWLGPKPPPPKPPKIAKPAQPAAGASAGAKGQNHKLEISLKAAKGSASTAAKK